MKIRLGSTEIGLFRYIGLWTIVVVVFTLQGLLHDAVNRGYLWSPFDYLRWSMIQWYTWAALAPLVFRLGERFPIQPPVRLRALGQQIVASLAVTLLAVVAGALVTPGSLDEQLAQYLSKYVAIGLLTYWALLAIQHALHFRAESHRRELEASRLATELAQSRLKVLKTQLQPHFLFNTLHAIITLLDEDTVSAEDMLLRLSELLRVFLEEYDGQEISLRRELELLDLYLGIQRKRFGDRLSTHIYVDPDTLDCAVPSLILQPIVENAIRHGIGRHAGADRVEIESRRRGTDLCIEVRNHNSTLEPGSEPAGHGIGLSNTRLRLKGLYGEHADLQLDMTWPRGVACRIRLPLRELENIDDAPEHVPA
ncbi:sensor histidine kinase [[Pseudomonas] boreopolis]|uniref:sensor histidine kinase n=1 Tax=Xanthomonas boreopolis TaxID=86183 RepID=UPI003D9B3B4B